MTGGICNEDQASLALTLHDTVTIIRSNHRGRTNAVHLDGAAGYRFHFSGAVFKGQLLPVGIVAFDMDKEGVALHIRNGFAPFTVPQQRLGLCVQTSRKLPKHIDSVCVQAFILIPQRPAEYLRPIKRAPHGPGILRPEVDVFILVRQKLRQGIQYGHAASGTGLQLLHEGFIFCGFFRKICLQHSPFGNRQNIERLQLRRMLQNRGSGFGGILGAACRVCIKPENPIRIQCDAVSFKQLPVGEGLLIRQTE